MNELALFAGAGGGILGGKLLGWRTVCAVEINAYAAGVLVARQNDGLLEPFPIWSNVETFDGRPWRGVVDVVSGGFPCQNISAAAPKEYNTGLDGESSGLWREMARIVGEVRPRFVFVENSPLLTGLGLDRVLADFFKLGFHAVWGVLGASQFGAPHRRDRIWIVAYADSAGVSKSDVQEKTAEMVVRAHERDPLRTGLLGDWWRMEPEPCSVVHGMAGVVDQLVPYGNGQVPIVAAEAWRILNGVEVSKSIERTLIKK
jgi:DNA (cytosine-5)-methyltransferase 1